MKEILEAVAVPETLPEKKIEKVPAVRGRTKGGLLLPPGIISWKDFYAANPDIVLTEEEERRRFRWDPEHHETFIVSENPDAQRQQNELRIRLFNETRICVSELRRYLQEHGVEVLINPRGKAGLSERQKKLPKIKILLLPPFFHSAEDKKARMQAVHGVADCLFHFSEEGELQTTRCHLNRDHFARSFSFRVIEGVQAAEKQITDAYKREDFVFIGDILGKVIEDALRLLKESER